MNNQGKSWLEINDIHFKNFPRESIFESDYTQYLQKDSSVTTQVINQLDATKYSITDNDKFLSRNLNYIKDPSLEILTYQFHKSIMQALIVISFVIEIILGVIDVDGGVSSSILA